MKKRIISLLLAVCLSAGLCSVLVTQANAYPTTHPNTHENTGDQRYDTVQIALSQVGYEENKVGTKYGAWWSEYLKVGYNYTSEAWCAMFILWCMHQAGCANGYQYGSASCPTMLTYYKNERGGNKAYAFGSGYTPRAGDIIFVASRSDGSTNHVGLIVSVSDDTITTVEGNYSDKVSVVSYDRTTGVRKGGLKCIIYYGVPNYQNDATEPGFDDPVTPSNPDENRNPVDYQTKTTASLLNVRTSPSTSSSVLTTLSKGTLVHIVEEALVGETRWGRLSSGGWISLAYTEAGNGGSGDAPQPSTPLYEGTVNCSMLNIRSAASTSSSVSGWLTNGQSVSIMEETTAGGLTWGRLSIGGWVATKYISKKDAAAPEQPETPETPDTPDTPQEPETPDVSIDGTVTASILNIRTAPATGDIIGTIARGSAVHITQTQTVNGTTWGKIESGWISMDYVKTSQDGGNDPGSDSESIQAVVTGSVVNLRAGAGTNHAIVGSVSYGKSLVLVETTTVSGTQWGRLSSGGWICMTYVKISSGTDTPAEPETPNGPDGGTISGTVTASVLNVRNAPGTGAVIASYSRGQSVTITETQTVGTTTWGKTSDGWISMDYVKTASDSASEGRTVTVTGSVVNIRSGAGTNHSIVGSVTQGQSCIIVETASASDGVSWGRLSSGGWICMTYVR